MTNKIKDGYTLNYVSDDFAIIIWFENGKLRQYKITAGNNN